MNWLCRLLEEGASCLQWVSQQADAMPINLMVWFGRLVWLGPDLATLPGREMLGQDQHREGSSSPSWETISVGVARGEEKFPDPIFSLPSPICSSPLFPDG